MYAGDVNILIGTCKNKVSIEDWTDVSLKAIH